MKRGRDAERAAAPFVHPCPVVALGASAGGLDALQALFSRIPAETGMAFVLVLHFDPRQGAVLPELLAQWTAMPVVQVADGTRAEVDRVYVIPPDATLTIDDCAFRLTPAVGARGRRKPIDGFFRSLADDQGDNAAGIILSGTGRDGALGLRAVKQAGGLTIVQAPETARYDAMPRAAIQVAAPDLVVPVEEIPQRLVEHQRPLLARHRREASDGLEGEQAPALGQITVALRARTGHDFSRYKRSTLVRRVRRRIHLVGAASVADYLERLEREPAEVNQLFKDLLIGVTHFFRDPEAFAALERLAVPKLFEGKAGDGQLRAWVPGCSTGEEVYSLAILLRERAAQLPDPPRLQVFATDIDEAALEVGRQGWYPESIAEQLSAERLARFFTRHGNIYQVAKEIREICLFSNHNLIADPPFSRLDLISCRNLLIYLEPELQKRLVPLYHFALRPGGYLFLGPSESVSGPLFRTVDKRHRIFEARDAVARTPLALPFGEAARPRAAATAPGGERPSSARERLVQAYERAVIEHFAPASVVVNERGEAVHFSPRAGRYLEHPPGPATLHVVDMARKGLRLALRTALYRAAEDHEEVVVRQVAVELENGVQKLDLVVRPLPEPELAGHSLVAFLERGPVAEAGGDLDATPQPPSDDPFILQLEDELRATRDHLQTLVEELEGSNQELISSNEELLSMNEELQSANEEMQTSREELQSVNEELETVNAELKKKVEQLDRANSDLQNLIRSSQIACIFLDGALRIRGFTPAATAVFRLIEGDLGRPLADIAAPFSVAEILDDARAVLATLGTRERQVRRTDRDAWYGLRILPYRTTENVIDGVVITFADSTEITVAAERLRETARRKDEFLAVLGHELRNPLAAVRSALHVFGMPQAQEEHLLRARQAIERQTRHLARLVDDLLDLSRISTGKILLRRRRLDLVELVRSETEDLRAEVECEELTLGLDLPPHPLWVHGDPTRLAQALANLLRNACKFTPAGGAVSVAVRDDGAETAELTVADTGIGMAPEVQAHLWEPFTQGPVLKRGRGGLGLGLALVKSLVELHGGTVGAESAGAGQGSRFTIRLPLQRGEPRSLPAAEGGTATAGRTLRCLLIEDNPDAADSMQLLLALDGHEVEVARDGAEGIARARALRPDVVICDIGLPGEIDGYGVARALRADPVLAGTHLIALTGYGQEEDRRRAGEAGFDAHVTKPADPDALRRMLAGLA